MPSHSSRFFPILLFLLLAVSRLTAQEVQINEDPKVSALFKTWVNTNRSNPGVDGWRVQIMASTDRVQVEEGRNRFRQSYPDISAEWVQEKPYYKLRVGAFHTRQEALAFIATLNEYPGSYPARVANIHPRDFLEQ